MKKHISNILFSFGLYGFTASLVFVILDFINNIDNLTIRIFCCVYFISLIIGFLLKNKSKKT